MNKPKEKKKIIQKLKHKYRLIIRSEDSLEEKAFIRLTRLNVIFIVSFILLIVSIGVFFLIAYTPLREYIPGYADFNTRREFSELVYKTDSIEHIIRQQEEYNTIVNNILTGNTEEYSKSHFKKKDTISVKKHSQPVPRSKEDSVLRAEFEKEESFNVMLTEAKKTDKKLQNILFFPPVKGVITEHFNQVEGHPAVDVASSPGEGIKATLEGTVVFADWNVNNGYTIIIQHKNNLISVYKHNSVLLKKIGNFVRAGEVIAIIGESGELSHGPHLHFEIWYDGNPINPEKYVAF